MTNLKFLNAKTLLDYCCKQPSYVLFKMNLLDCLRIVAFTSAISNAQQALFPPSAALCHPNATTVVCVHKYAAVLPYPFRRETARNGSYGPTDTFQQTDVPEDPSFNLLTNASFLVFDKDRGLKILGPNPSNKFMFTVEDYVHEAPVYAPEKHAIIFSTFAYGVSSQLLINLTASPPTLENYNPTPPVSGINGGRYYKGLVYWAVSGSKPFANGTLEEPGLVTLDPKTDKVAVLLNNYFGNYFDSPNDLVIDSGGDVFFTDAIYGWQQNVTATPASLPTAVYRFRPSTGEVHIIENGLVEPNGIGLSPDEKTMYITDTGAEYSTIYAKPGTPYIPLRYNATGARTVYAYDVIEGPAGKYIVGRRPVWVTQEGLPDGFHVARNGYLLTAAGKGLVFLGVCDLRLVC